MNQKYLCGDGCGKRNMTEYEDKNDHKTSYPLIIGHYLPVLSAELEGMKGCDKVNASQDLIGSLKLIRGL